MTTRDRPDPPTDLERPVREALAPLEDRDPETLRAVGQYLEELAAWKEIETDGERDETGADDVEYPEDVPERANVTVKEIAGTTYHYYQWREGDRIESKTVQRE